MAHTARVVKEEVAQFACPNPACAYCGKRPSEGGKLWADQRKGQEQIRLLRCGHCRKTFSERRGTALEEARLPAAEVEQIVTHPQEGCGIRRAARLTGHARSTVARYAVVAGAHARAVHDETRRGLPCAEVQAEEQWAFVGKKRGALRRRR
jgi:transposase-like protein